MANRHSRRAASASLRGPAAPPAAAAEIDRMLERARKGMSRAADFAADGFDAAWMARVADAGDASLGVPASAFRRAAFAEASRAPMMARMPDGSTEQIVGDLFLLPFVGMDAAVAAFANDRGRLSALATSFQRHGMVGRDAMAIVLPVPVAPEALEAGRTGPAAVRRLTVLGTRLLLGIVSGQGEGSLSRVREAMSQCVKTKVARAPSGGAARLTSGAFAVVRVERMPPGTDRIAWMSSVATRRETMDDAPDGWIADGSFRDPGFILLPPARWSAAASSLAVRRAQAAMAAAADHDALMAGGGVFPQVHFARDPRDGSVLVAGVAGGAAGPVQSIPGGLWASDPDGAMATLAEIGDAIYRHAAPADMLAALA